MRIFDLHVATVGLQHFLTSVISLPHSSGISSHLFTEMVKKRCLFLNLLIRLVAVSALLLTCMYMHMNEQ